MATKKVSDEQIAAALLANGTIKRAAAAVDLSERAVYDRMNEKDFQAVYKSAKADLIRAAVLDMNGKLQAAIDTIAEIMTDKENKPATRLQAAQIIINNAGRFAERLQDDENAARAEKNSYDFRIEW